MSKMISLNRFTWIPCGIGPHTPRCVLDEWAETLGIQPDLWTTPQIVQKIQERNALLSNTLLPSTGPSLPDHWARLAQFINPRCKWTQTALSQAWSHLDPTLRPNGFTTAPLGEVGWPSPRAPKRIPVTLAYGYLVSKGIYVPSDATPNRLAELLHLSARPVGEAGIRKAILALLHTRPDIAVSTWSFMVEQSRSLLNEPYVAGSDQGERLRTLFQVWESKMFKIEHYEPRTHDEAVLLAAMHYGVDLHTASNPLNEYTHLVLSTADHAGKSRSHLWGCIQYIHTADPKLAVWTSRHPSALSLSHTYLPVFPVELWPHDAATDLAERWGKSATHESHAMTTNEFLQWRAVSFHVYHGLPRNVRNTKTPIELHDIATLPAANLLGFGNEDHGYELMTSQELQAYLNSTHQASWPTVQGTLPIDDCALAQLERLAKDQKWYDLVQAIRAIKEESSDERRSVNELVTAYRKASLSEKLAIDNVLWTWLYFGMSMRGWTATPPSSTEAISKSALYINTPFPLHETDVEHGDTLDLRVHRWGELLYEALGACSTDWRKRLAGARLYLFSDNQYLLAHDREQGLTLEDRLRILTRTDNVHACIRLSSNWMCSSAYYYFIQLDHAVPFAIRDLVRIS
jgi:hypothetical protein